MQNQKLNLTRSWRSKQFSEIVGQNIVVKILQNSLYGNQLFPVYLLSGQRGCGKTSTARVFASALNCEQLPEFQKNPQQHPLPCLQCASCQAMTQGRHPDFVEIDAASYTGVDNIRSIIDTSSFLPLLGKRKIYLIDEAHMLSRAAFNAFLKILEEPPPFVVFMLATTDSHKILETVKSRSFQLFFDPIDPQDTVAHLQKICEKENISAQSDALHVIARETEGSLRDAINLLEQVRFVGKQVSLASVYQVLGHISEQALFELLAGIVAGDVQKVLQSASDIMQDGMQPEQAWKQVMHAVYDMIATYYHTPTHMYAHEKLQPLVQNTTVHVLLRLFEKICSYEEVLQKSSAKKIAFQMGLLQLVSLRTSNNSSSPQDSGAVQTNAPSSSVSEYEEDDSESECTGNRNQQPSKDEVTSAWSPFLESLSQEEDLVLVSVFKESKIVQFDASEEKLEVAFLKKFMVFADIIEEKQAVWKKHFYNFFKQSITLSYSFTHQDATSGIQKSRAQQSSSTLKDSASNEEPRSFSQPAGKQPAATRSSQGYSARTSAIHDRHYKKIDVSDEQQWPKAALLRKYFTGTFVEVTGDLNS